MVDSRVHSETLSTRPWRKLRWWIGAGPRRGYLRTTNGRGGCGFAFPTDGAISWRSACCIACVYRFFSVLVFVDGFRRGRRPRSPGSPRIPEGKAKPLILRPELQVLATRRCGQRLVLRAEDNGVPTTAKRPSSLYCVRCPPCATFPSITRAYASHTSLATDPAQYGMTSCHYSSSVVRQRYY